jgi:hypothetical protein
MPAANSSRARNLPLAWHLRFAIVAEHPSGFRTNPSPFQYSLMKAPARVRRFAFETRRIRDQTIVTDTFMSILWRFVRNDEAAHPVHIEFPMVPEEV